MKHILLLLAVLSVFIGFSQELPSSVMESISSVEKKVISWRRDIHQHPELSNRETRTAKVVADHLRALGLEVTTGVAKTGVVGILKGWRNGKVLALRADMDALPVTERTDIPFKSTVTTSYLGQETGVMHACGHDTHVAMLMGVAEVLSKNRDFAGTIKFIFQPAEEGAPPGEEGGASLMIKEGVLENPKVDAIVGLHIGSYLKTGMIAYKPKGAMAASQRFTIEVTGKQTHGSAPWGGVDPIYISAKIIDGVQSLVSREAELTKAPLVLSFGKITSGVRNNIIPESASLVGTLRTLDYGMQKKVNLRMKELIPALAKAYGGSATIDISPGIPITYNDPDLTEMLLPSLQKAAGTDNVVLTQPTTGAEDFAFFQQQIPGFYFFLGGKPEGGDSDAYYPHHTPDFKINENAMILGVKAFTQIVFDYLK